MPHSLLALRVMIIINNYANVYNAWYIDLINENTMKTYFPIGVGSWSRSIVIVPSWKYRFPFLTCDHNKVMLASTTINFWISNLRRRISV